MAVRRPRLLASSASRIPRPSTTGYTGHSALCGNAWTGPGFTQETCSNPPAAVRLTTRAELTTVHRAVSRCDWCGRSLYDDGSLQQAMGSRHHELGRAHPDVLPRRLDRHAHPA